MYFDEPVEGTVREITITPGSLIGQLILLAGTVYFGIVASNIFDATIQM
jgi:NADH-quinone oxidoreductase subunit N